jgi:predicted transcriptional regulator
MNTRQTNVIADLRGLLPARALDDREARATGELQATRLLSVLDQYEPPVDVSLICELPRVRVRVVPTLPDSGLTHWERGTWVIGINRNDSRTRRRFSLGHEFKHILDHTHIDELYLDEHGQSAPKQAELMCDHFAACLLMPRPWVKRLWAQGAHDAEELAARFNVSPAAMDRRLQELGLVPRRRRHTGPDTERTYFRRTGVVAAPLAT